MPFAPLRRKGVQKEEIRERVSKRRLLLSTEEAGKKSSLIVDRLKSLSLEDFDSFLFYYPVKNEVSLLELAQDFLRIGKVVAFPKVVGKEIVPVRVDSLSRLLPGKFSIPEPPLSPDAVLKEVSVIFVPGLAFDLECYRLGYGGGYYDRFLPKFQSALKVGVCYDFQLLDRLPREPFDVPVDIVVTENRTTRRKKWKQY